MSPLSIDPPSPDEVVEALRAVVNRWSGDYHCCSENKHNATHSAGCPLVAGLLVLARVRKPENGESGRAVSEDWAAEALASAVADGLLKPSQPDITISGRGASPALQPAGPAPPPEFVEGRFAMPLVTSDELGRRDGPPRAGRGAEFPTDDGSYVVNVIPDPPRAPAASDCPSCDGRGTIYTFVDTRTTDEKRFFACKACDGTGRRKG